MNFNFDAIIDRRQTNNIKWNLTAKHPGEPELLPLWVADMDFQSPPEVSAALRRHVEHGMFGYPIVPDSCYNAMIAWLKHRHGWEIDKEWIIFTPGVIPAFYWTIQAFTQPGDAVLIQPPVYPPFFKSVSANNCVLVENELRNVNGHYEMDMDAFEAQIKSSGAKVFVLCSPHNPVGRVWTDAELRQMAECCLKHDVIICSDEIHADIVFRGARHIPTATLSTEIAARTVSCFAASKTFNIAGLNTAFAVIPDPDIRAAFQRVKHNVGNPEPNLMGVIATEAAYRHGAAWLDALLEYLKGNYDFLTRFLQERMPQITAAKSEGTYLAWLDCRNLGLTDAELHDLFMNKARVWLNDGTMFGSGGSGFQRLNFACPRATLEMALTRIERAVKEKI